MTLNFLRRKAVSSVTLFPCERRKCLRKFTEIGAESFRTQAEHNNLTFSFKILSIDISPDPRITKGPVVYKSNCQGFAGAKASSPDEGNNDTRQVKVGPETFV
ncbi:hypothetical protein Trydic_g3976 [Trypoxylus dichotomus]